MTVACLFGAFCNKGPQPVFKGIDICEGAAPLPTRSNVQPHNGSPAISLAILSYDVIDGERCNAGAGRASDCAGTVVTSNAIKESTGYPEKKCAHLDGHYRVQASPSWMLTT